VHLFAASSTPGLAGCRRAQQWHPRRLSTSDADRIRPAGIANPGVDSAPTHSESHEGLRLCTSRRRSR
jgi:hypothetical protein